MLALTPNEIDYLFIVAVLVFAFRFFASFLHESSLYGKMTDFCQSIILLALAVWLWFNHRVVDITIDGTVYRGLPEKLFSVVVITSLGFLLPFAISEYVSRKRKERKA